MFNDDPNLYEDTEQKPQEQKPEKQEPQEQEQKPEKQKKKKSDEGSKVLSVISKILILIIIACLAFGIFTVYQKFNHTPVVKRTEKGDVIVPDLKGLKKEEAERVLQSTQLGLKQNKSIISDEPSGTVINQDPKSGTVVSPHTTITIDVSEGSSKTQMPNVVSKTLNDAVQILTEAGIQNYEIQLKRGGSLGIVTATDPKTGEELVNTDTTILYVDTGEEVMSYPRKYIGLNEKDALTSVKEDKLIPVVKYAYSEMAPEGTVFIQSIDKNAPVVSGSIEYLTVSRGSVQTDILEDKTVKLGIPKTATGGEYMIVAREITDYDTYDLVLDHAETAPEFPLTIKVPILRNVKSCVITYYEKKDGYIPKANWYIIDENAEQTEMNPENTNIISTATQEEESSSEIIILNEGQN